jgi:multidrug efflux pump subunit AcrA (membrane-fusion protein)
LPADAGLVITARLNPIHVDNVRPGMDVQVRLLPLANRNQPPLEGRVTRVSADALLDARTGQQYYEVEVAFTDTAGESDVITAGMPAEVYIITGERTFLQYILEPLLNSFNHSFREP